MAGAELLTSRVGLAEMIPYGVLSARGGPLRVDGAADALADGAGHGDASGLSGPGSLHASEVVVEFFGEVGGHESQGVGIEFAVVERNAEMFAAGATLKARIAGEVIGHVVKGLALGGLAGDLRHGDCGCVVLEVSGRSLGECQAAVVWELWKRRCARATA